MLLAVAFVVATGADLLTWCALLLPGSGMRELNPVVIALGPAAPAVRLGLAAAVVPLAWSFRHPRLRRYRAVGPAVLLVGIVVGLVGAVSNLPTY